MFNHHTISIRVRYTEVDAMGYLHHSRFLQYFEMGRIEFLRAAGFSYADLERQGVFFVVTKAEVRYKAPARYDDELTLTTRVVRGTLVRFDHAYELRRGNVLLAEGTTTIACVGPDGKVRAMPEALINSD
ncbi:MAG: thioesterase family protein [Tepidisphaeraceae bacterium]|jgi:acyl-CoA thioester hydrolase